MQAAEINESCGKVPVLLMSDWEQNLIIQQFPVQYYNVLFGIL